MEIGGTRAIATVKISLRPVRFAFSTGANVICPLGRRFVVNCVGRPVTGHARPVEDPLKAGGEKRETAERRVYMEQMERREVLGKGGWVRNVAASLHSGPCVRCPMGRAKVARSTPLGRLQSSLVRIKPGY